MKNLEIFVLGHEDEQLASLPSAPHLTPVNLNKLDLGEWQHNELAESRIYLSDLPEQSRADYVGFCTARWHQKYPRLPKLVDLDKVPLSPAVVYCAAPRLTQDWWNDNLYQCPGMHHYLNEFLAYTGLHREQRMSFYANQFICSRGVYLAFQDFFRKTLPYFHNKYGFNYDFTVDMSRYGNRKAACFYEYWTSLYYANRQDLIIRGI